MNNPQLMPPQQLLDTTELPEPGPRPGVQAEIALNCALDRLTENVPRQSQQLVRALILLRHDHLDAAHTIAQSIENADGAFVHGIMHRREPDYKNAAYWFRRVGRHSAFAGIASEVSFLLAATEDSSLRQRLIPDGQWEPFAFMDACREGCRG
jgi:hypothetical protein